MKFSLKLLFWTVIIMALAFGFSGFYFVNYVFETSIARETRQAMEESRILRFAFETAVLSVPVQYDVLPDHTIEQITYNLANGGSSRLLRISDEMGQIIYESDGFGENGQEDGIGEGEESLLPWTDEERNAYQVVKRGEHYYIRTCMIASALNRSLYLETMRDVSEVFRERKLGFDTGGRR